MTSATLYSGLVDKYRDRLPILAATKAVSLCEGNTPLIPLDSLLEGAAETSGKGVRLFAKFEGLNPLRLDRQYFRGCGRVRGARWNALLRTDPGR